MDTAECKCAKPQRDSYYKDGGSFYICRRCLGARWIVTPQEAKKTKTEVK